MKRGTQSYIRLCICGYIIVSSRRGADLCPLSGDDDTIGVTVTCVSNAAQGVLDRDTNMVHLFERAGRTKKATDMPELDLHDPKLPELITEELHEQLLEDVEMLDE